MRKDQLQLKNKILGILCPQVLVFEDLQSAMTFMHQSDQFVSTITQLERTRPNATRSKSSGRMAILTKGERKGVDLTDSRIGNDTDGI